MATDVTSASLSQSHSFSYFIKSSLAGGLSGCIAKSAIAPLDRVKILFQGYRPEYIRHAGSTFGVFKAMAQIFDTHGFSGLYQSHSVTLLRIFPSAAIRFMAYEQFRMLLIPTPDKNSPFRHFLAGSCAGHSAVLCTYPFEVIRTRMAFEIRNTRLSHGLLQTARLILSERPDNKYLGFYKGFTPTMIGIMPYAGATFMSYQWLRSQCLGPWKSWATFNTDNPNTSTKINVLVHLWIGGMAGMVGQTIAYPFDTIRHRMQLEGVAVGIPKYSSTLDALVQIARREGVRGFFIGLSINYWKTMPANAIAFVVYDYLKHSFGIGDE